MIQVESITKRSHGSQGAMASPLRVGRTVFDRVLRRIATGVSVVTTAVGGEWNGLLVRDFIVAAVEPPTLLLSAPPSSEFLAAISESGIFCVNVLADADADVASQFAASAPAEQRFKQRNWASLATGAPALVGCVASLDCQLVETFAASSFTAFAGEVLTAELWSADRPPLIHHDKTYIRL